MNVLERLLKALNYVAVFILALASGVSCEEKYDHQPVAVIEETIPTETRLLPDDSKTYKLSDAIASDFIDMKAEGMGTFQKIHIAIKNTSDGPIKIEIPAGLYFVNPDGASQSLITAYKKETMFLNAKEATSFNISSYCTNVKLKIPGTEKGWEFNSEYKGGLDEVVAFYGKHEKGINKWLEKRNPMFAQESRRLAFFQTVIWMYEGGNYDQILGMLSKDVFKNDIEIAKSFLNTIQAQAQEIASLLKEGNKQRIRAWVSRQLADSLPTREEISTIAEEGRNRIQRLRDRFK